MNYSLHEENIKKHKIELLDCQVDLVLKSLEFYLYTYDFMNPIQKKAKTKEENLKISLLRDTYEQILSQHVNTENIKVFNKKENKFKKIS